MTEWSNLLEEACRFYEKHLTGEHRAFLLSRYGFRPEFVEASRIGYAPADGTALLLHLMDRGFEGEEIVRSGLIFRREKSGGTVTGDLFRGRIVFPYLAGDQTPAYFIARATDATPTHGDDIPPKYVKQIATPDGPKEPIFGYWSVMEGAPLIITEGIADALAALQDCRSCISPVTTAFKRERIDEAAEYCRRAGSVCIINDNEESSAGLKGAARTALALLKHGITRVYIGSLPRPEGVAKLDLNDYLREGGDLDPILAAAIPADDHPAVEEERRQEWEGAATIYRSDLARQRRAGKPQGEDDDIEELKRRMPSLSAYTGIAPGKRGSHPVCGSTHGDNFAISRDGETWTSFHGGNEKGKSGNIFKVIALEQGFLADEGLALRGEAFVKTIAYCRERWGGRREK
jgi:hypothetical protein